MCIYIYICICTFGLSQDSLGSSRTSESSATRARHPSFGSNHICILYSHILPSIIFVGIHIDRMYSLSFVGTCW